MQHKHEHIVRTAVGCPSHTELCSLCDLEVNVASQVETVE